MKTNRLYFQRPEVTRWMTTRRKPKPKRRRPWKPTGTVIPIIISIAALVVSGFSYWDQHQSSEAAATAQQESEARLVTSLWDNQTSTLTVQNLGITEITSIDEVFNINFYGGTLDNTFLNQLIINIHISSPLPPCSSLITNERPKIAQNDLKKADFLNMTYPESLRGVEKLEEQATSVLVGPVLINFDDAQGNNWTESPSGELIRGGLPTAEKINHYHFVNNQLADVYKDDPVKANDCR